MEELIKQLLIGYGDGYGDGDGSGYGDGYGSGDGSGSGSGDGSGYGDGSGSGDGDGYGDGYGDGIKLNSYKGHKVYYIDGIPCYFVTIKKNKPFAKVSVIGINDLSLTTQFVFNFNGCFAHGDTLKDAKRDAENKYYSQLDTAERIKAFIEKFKPGIKYDSSLFYEWHSKLTGSCQSGKSMFVKQNGIDLEGKMTVDEFISITKDAYGGEIIRQLQTNYQ